MRDPFPTERSASSLLRETFPVGLLQCNCTILADTASHEALVIDPGDDLARILAFLELHQLKLTQIFVTHAHIDHIGGAAKLKCLTGAPVFFNQQDLFLLPLMDVQAAWLGLAAAPEVRPPDASLEQGTKVAAAGWQGEILHTPGHTPGSICLHFPQENLLLAGDLLFAGSIGRTDLPGGDFAQMERSLKQSILPLADATVVVPGHGPETLMGTERRSNPYLLRLV